MNFGAYSIDVKNNGSSEAPIVLFDSKTNAIQGNIYQVVMPYRASYPAQYFIEVKGGFGTKRIELTEATTREKLLDYLNSLGVGEWGLDSTTLSNTYKLFTPSSALTFEFDYLPGSIDAWANENIASYRANNLHIPALEWAGIESYLNTLFTTDTYYFTTFSGSTSGDWFFYLKTSGDITTRTITKTGAILKWNIDGNIYNQNNLPAYTKGANAGNVICSDVNAFVGVSLFEINNNNFINSVPNFNFPNCTSFQINNNQFSGTAPLWDLPNCSVFQIENNLFSGTAPLWDLPNCTRFYILSNQFSGTAPLWVMPNCTRFYISGNLFSGTAPLWSLPNCTGFQIQNNQFSGTAPLWDLPNCTQFYIYSNQFSGTAPLWDLPLCIDFQIYSNQFSGTAPLWDLPNCTQFYIYSNQFSGTAPLWDLPNCTTFYIFSNQFSGTAPLWDLPNCTQFLIMSNQFSGTAPLWNLPNCTSFSIYSNQFSGVLNVTLSNNVQVIEVNANDITSSNLIAKKSTTNVTYSQNNFLTSNIDAFLAAQEAYTLANTPTVNLLMTLNGGGMPIPSAAGLISRTNIINAYIAAGRTATINVNS